MPEQNSVTRVPLRSVGHALRHERELRGMTTSEIAAKTRIPVKILEAIEDERFAELPGEVFVRGFVKSYAQALGLDPRPLVARLHLDEEVEFSTLSFDEEDDRARKVGVAFAVVVLLLLFSLALSVVLRPRHHDAPVELSECTITPLHIG